MPMDLETARNAITLYAELASHDNKLRAMQTKPAYGDTPLQKVTFYSWTPTVSGPADYTPKHKLAAIANNIIIDMKIERTKIAKAIVALGFEVPPYNPDR